MINVVKQENNDHLEPERALILSYKGEDDQSFLVASRNGVRLRVPKNRNVQKTLIDRPSRELNSGLSFAGLGFFRAGAGRAGHTRSRAACRLMGLGNLDHPSFAPR